MSIKPGDRIPSATLQIMGEKGPQEITTEALFAGRKVVLFAVPGAFTPGCSNTHLPGFVVNADKIRAKGVDSIICLAVNDAFVMDAWGKTQNADAIEMVADGNAGLTRAMGLELDASGFGMGTRSKRYAMIVDDGVVKYLGVDNREIVDSSAEKVLSRL